MDPRTKSGGGQRAHQKVVSAFHQGASFVLGTGVVRNNQNREETGSEMAADDTAKGRSTQIGDLLIDDNQLDRSTGKKTKCFHRASGLEDVVPLQLGAQISPVSVRGVD
jgi:hypothetical protein